jgi:succinoglycan biosynthesis protein ExoA
MMRPLPEHPRISVVVPAKGAAGVVERAIASAAAQDGVDEIVIAAGDDATRQVVEGIGDPRLRVVDNPTGRTPDALNAAIEASTGEVIVRLDAQAELPRGYVARAVDTLRRTGAANVGGMQVPTADRGFAAAVAAAMRSPAGAGGATYRVGGDEGPVDTVYLGVFRREALTAVGGFDPAFARNQDAELNLRLQRAGFQVWFDPKLTVAYTPRDRVGALASQYLQYGRWRRLTARTHAGSLAPRQLAAPALVLGFLALAALGATTGLWFVLGLAVALYLAALIIAAAAAVPVLRRVPATVVAFATMHLSWGVGFLLGPPRPRS